MRAQGTYAEICFCDLTLVLNATICTRQKSLLVAGMSMNFEQQDLQETSLIDVEYVPKWHRDHGLHTATAAKSLSCPDSCVTP